MAILEEITETECVNERHPFVIGDNYKYFAITGKQCDIRCKLILFASLMWSCIQAFDRHQSQ